MTPLRRWLLCILVVFTSTLTAACDEGGIGICVPSSGARWGSGTSGPGVFVGGGPVYR